MTLRLAQFAAAMVALMLVSLVAIVWGATRSSTDVRAQAAAQVVITPPPATTTAASSLPSTRPHVVEPTPGITSTSASRFTGPMTTADVPSPTTISPDSAVPVSDAVIRQELLASGVTANPDQAQLTPNLLAVAPIGAPLAVQQVIQAGNEIARLPYVWGGGHGTYADTGYDCSGSISFVFAAAHLINTTMVSGELAGWGDPGPGKWITIFANAGHTFMYVAGLRFDTVALAETGSRWSARSADEPDLRTFSIRHPPGL